MLTRWDPFREMLTMRRTMDRLIDSAFSNEEMGQAPEWGLPLDVVEQEEDYLVKASIPGIKPEDLEITYNKGVLTIKGQVKDEAENDKGQYHLRERRFGTFARSISLPTSVKSDEIQASYQDGILTLTLPKAEEVKPKRIPIQSGGEKKVLDARHN